MQRIQIDPEHPDPRLIKRAVADLQQGAVIAYPTDTVYGIGCDFRQKRSIDRIYELKQMRKDRQLAFLCPDLGDGTYVIAPGGSSISVQCEMGVSGGGWTQMTQEYLNTMGGETWEYLYTLNNGWYRSPPTSHVWNWDSFHGVAGTYAYGQGDNQTGTFGCNTNEGGG